MFLSFLNFIFKLQLSFNIILYCLQVYNLVVRQLDNLPNDPTNNSSTHLAPYIVITILLTVFSMLHFTSLGLFRGLEGVTLSAVKSEIKKYHMIFRLHMCSLKSEINGQTK